MANLWDLPEVGAGLVKVLRVVTDRGILIRTGVAVAGVLMMVLGLVLLFREPIGRTAAAAAKAAV